jgi:integrase
MKKHAGTYDRNGIKWIQYTWQSRQYFESSHSSDIRDAKALLAKRKAELIAGRIPNRISDVPTVDGLLGLYIAQIENPATQKRYRLSQRALFPICGNCRINEVDAFTFDRFKELRLKQGVSPAGVNRDLALPRAAFNFAVTRRLLVHSPLDGVKLFNEAKHRKPPHAWSFAEEFRIRMCCDLRLSTIFTTLLETGMRIGSEALKLKWCDVDFQESTITVVRSKTAAGLRTLPMTRLVKCDLLKWHAATKGISEYVFFNPQQPSKPILSVKTAWHNTLRLAGLPRVAAYQCRHTYATRLAAAGVSDTIIDQLLGHSRRDVLRFYTVRVPEFLRDAIYRLENLRSSKTAELEMKNISDNDVKEEYSQTTVN